MTEPSLHKILMPSWRLAVINSLIPAAIQLVPCVAMILFMRNVLKMPRLAYWMGILLAYIFAYFGFKWAGAYMTKNYVVVDTRAVIRWQITIFLLVGMLASFSAISGDIVPKWVEIAMRIIDLILSLIMIYYFVPKFLIASSQEEVRMARFSLTNQPSRSIMYWVGRVTLRLLGALALLIITPIIISLIFHSALSLSYTISGSIIFVCELCIIGLLIKRYVFVTEDERMPRVTHSVHPVVPKEIKLT